MKFNPGNIVYHNNLYFKEQHKDTLEKRLCIVIFSLNYKNKEYVCTCPTSKNIEGFNKNSNDYFLIPDTITKDNKIYFAKISDVDFHEISDTYKAEYPNIYDNTLMRINKKICDVNKVNPDKKAIVTYLEYLALFDQTENYYDKKIVKKRT